MSIYRVAVCDDDAAMLESLCSLCREILAEEEIHHEITAFASAEDLKEELEIQSDSFDLLILDIQMEGMTGMELAYSRRDHGDRVSIIFITACDDYLAEGYEVQPIHFLLKPVRKDMLHRALLTDWKLNHLPKTAVLHFGSKTASLLLSGILYIESYNHSVVVHRSEGSQTYPVSLSEIGRQLPTGQFCRCHNSYIVNLSEVQEIGRTELALRSGGTLPIGRTYYKSFQEKFIRYLNQ